MVVEAYGIVRISEVDAATVSFFQASSRTAAVVVSIVAERRQRAVQQRNQQHAAQSTRQVRYVVHV